MQQIAAENNLAETAFFVKSGDEYEIRWFTPAVEVNLCGHATLASSYVIFNCLGLEKSEIKFRSHRSGSLGVSKVGDLIILDFPANPLREIETLPELATAEVPPLRSWESQKNMLIMLLRSEDEVRTLDADMQRVRVRVADQGPGIARALGPRVFEPFVQGGQALTDKSPGVGLGLSIARGLLRNAGGDLVLLPSERGALFEIHLPHLLPS
jgi:predicted PhzF superfamily epimerase YddE/YHI9